MVCLRLCWCFAVGGGGVLKQNPFIIHQTLATLEGAFTRPLCSSCLLMSAALGSGSHCWCANARTTFPFVVYTRTNCVPASAAVCLVLGRSRESRLSHLLLQNQSVGLDVKRVSQWMMEPRMLNAAQKGSLPHPDTHTHTRARRTKTLLCILHVWKAYMKGWMRAGGGVAGTGLIRSQSLWVCLMEIPPPHSQINVASGGLDASLPAVQTLLLLFAFQQMEDSGGRFPRFSPPCAASLLFFRSLSQQMKFKALLSVQQRLEEENLNPLRLLAAHLLAFFKTASTQHHTFFFLALSLYLLLLHCMLVTWVHSRSVLRSSAWKLCFRLEWCSDSVVGPCGECDEEEPSSSRIPACQRWLSRQLGMLCFNVT